MIYLTVIYLILQLYADFVSVRPLVRHKIMSHFYVTFLGLVGWRVVVEWLRIWVGVGWGVPSNAKCCTWRSSAHNTDFVNIYIYIYFFNLNIFEFFFCLLKNVDLFFKQLLVKKKKKKNGKIWMRFQFEFFSSTPSWPKLNFSIFQLFDF